MFDMFGGRRHHQQQPCWNKMIPWLFKTIHKEQIIIKKTKICNEKKKKNGRKLSHGTAVWVLFEYLYIDLIIYLNSESAFLGNTS